MRRKGLSAGSGAHGQQERDSNRLLHDNNILNNTKELKRCMKYGWVVPGSICFSVVSRDFDVKRR